MQFFILFFENIIKTTHYCFCIHTVIIILNWDMATKILKRMKFSWIFEILSVDPNKYDFKWRLEAQHVEPVNIFFMILIILFIRTECSCITDKWEKFRFERPEKRHMNLMCMRSSYILLYMLRAHFKCRKKTSAMHEPISIFTCLRMCFAQCQRNYIRSSCDSISKRVPIALCNRPIK